MFQKGQRVRWKGVKPRLGTVHKDQYFDYVEVNWDDGIALNPSKSCGAFCELVSAPIYSEDLCEWIISNLLTEEQLDVVKPGEAYSLRYARHPSVFDE